jgi:hypothetical protein
MTKAVMHGTLNAKNIRGKRNFFSFYHYSSKLQPDKEATPQT